MLSFGLVATILKDDCKHNGSVVLTGFFRDTLGQTYRSMTTSNFDIDEWYIEPPTDEEREIGDVGRHSLFGVGQAAVEALRESREN